MKKILLALAALFTFSGAFAQCNDLFISVYVEGYGNNRALEIYNPTNAAINLSQYSVGRFSNGSTSFTGIQLPNATIAAYGTYTVVLDKRDSLGTGLETPIWNGYQLWDTCRDALTQQPIIDGNGNVVFCVQYNSSGLHLYGTVYHDFLDLEGRGDVFLCPDYNVNNAMYFNGNDAVAIIKGTSVSPDGSNILDVIGIIGQDPGDNGWADANGAWYTKDKTIVRRPTVEGGTGAVVFALQDTFAFHEWERLPKNEFTPLDETHPCTCDPNYTSTDPVQVVDFNLYPNPVSNGQFVIEAAENIRNVSVFNLLGELVYEINLHANEAQINLPNIAKGIYIVRLTFEGNKIGIKKLVNK